MNKYIVYDSSGCRETIEADTAGLAAGIYVESGDWEASTSTWWCNVTVVGPMKEGETEAATEEDGRYRRVRVAVEPDEPACSADEHDWQRPVALVGGIESNPGVWGHGGGVTIQEVCMTCGCGKKTDTWAQDMEDGVQGLTSVTFLVGQFDVEQS